MLVVAGLLLSVAHSLLHLLQVDLVFHSKCCSMMLENVSSFFIPGLSRAALETEDKVNLEKMKKTMGHRQYGVASQVRVWRPSEFVVSSLVLG